MRLTRISNTLLAVVCALSAAPLVFAQVKAEEAHAATAAPEHSAAELAKQTQNPIASLISVPFQYNSNNGAGPTNTSTTDLNFQPVIPFAISKSTNVILRVVMPLLSAPLPNGERTSGIGDTLTSVFFSPSKPGKIIWGLGPAIQLPTATNKALGSEQFAMGPTAVALMQPGHWTLGMLWNHLWTVSGASDRKRINQDYIQPFINYNLGNGLALGVSMEATMTLKAADPWSGPALVNLTKVTMLRRQPVQIGMSAGPYVFRPNGDASWRFRFTVNFLFPRGAA